MVMRTGSSGRSYRSAVSYAQTMMPERIVKLASYIYVDRALVLRLVETGLEFGNVDQIRTLLILNQNPGFDISSPLDNYDELVMELAKFIVDDNLELIESEIKKAQTEALGLEVEGVPGEEVSEEVEGPEVVEERPKAKEVKIPEKIKVVHKKTGEVTYRTKATPWKARKQKGMSSQEQFVYVRAGRPAKEVQREYVQHFGIYRSPVSIKTKQIRLMKKVPLTSEEKTQQKGQATSGMVPK